MNRAKQGTRLPASHSIGIWGPFTWTMVVLVTLLILPMISLGVVRRASRPLSEVVDPARLAVSTFEASFGTELYLSTIPASDIDSTIANRSRVAIANQTRTAASLRRVLRDVAPLDTALQGVLAAAEAWRAARRAVLVGSADSATTISPGIATLVASDRLDDSLDDLAQATRARVSAIERLNVGVSIALVLVAGVGVGLLTWAGKRTARLAEFAENQRRALVLADEARDKLLRHVSHDLRNPLSVAVSFHELLERGYFGELNEQQTDAVRSAQRQIRLAVRLATDVLDTARREGRGLTSQRSSVLLDLLVRELVLDHAANAERNGVVLESHTEPDATGASALTDADSIRQIVTNLISNAIKYASKGGRIVVRAGKRAHGPPIAPAARLTIEVADSGPGIPAQDRERIFQESVRLADAATVAGGAGIGLASARRLARELDGDLSVESNGGGSTFILWLPLQETGA